MITRRISLLMLALVLASCSDDDNKGGDIVAGCDAPSIEISVTGELTPQYSWTDGDEVNSLTVARVANLDYIAANPTICAAAAAPGGTPDPKCELAYVRNAMPDLATPTVARNLVDSPVMHGAASGAGLPPSVVALTEENPLENGVQYQISLIRVSSGGTAAACGCLRFTAGSAKTGSSC